MNIPFDGMIFVQSVKIPGVSGAKVGRESNERDHSATTIIEPIWTDLFFWLALSRNASSAACAI